MRQKMIDLTVEDDLVDLTNSGNDSDQDNNITNINAKKRKVNNIAARGIQKINVVAREDDDILIDISNEAKIALNRTHRIRGASSSSKLNQKETYSSSLDDRHSKKQKHAIDYDHSTSEDEVTFLSENNSVRSEALVSWEKMKAKSPLNYRNKSIDNLMKLTGLEFVKKAFLKQFNVINLCFEQGSSGPYNLNTRFEGNPGILEALV